MLKALAHACRHIQNAKKYGIPVVIAINKFATDTDAELQAVETASKDAGEFQITAVLRADDLSGCTHMCLYEQSRRMHGKTGNIDLARDVSVETLHAWPAFVFTSGAHGDARLPHLGCSLAENLMRAGCRGL